MEKLILKSHFGTQRSYIFALYITIITTLLDSQASSFGCVLDLQHQYSTRDNSNCEAGNWGGFVANSCSCETGFEDYLYALALRANKTKRVFLSPKEQKDCLLFVTSIDRDVSGCGLQKLTSQPGGCHEYSVDDVLKNLGTTLKLLEEDCEFLGSTRISNAKSCSVCLKRWEEIVKSSSKETESEENEDMVCGFSVLITLTSGRIYDKNWIRALYKCLGSQETPTESEKRDRDGKRLSIGIGFWILGGCISVTIALIIVITTPKLCKRSSKEEDTSCPKMNIKEVYLATNDLDPCNLIGQGVSGKVYRGVLLDGQCVAVKHIIKDGHGRNVDTFIREVKSLSHVKHPNLIALIGFSEAVDECFLVYELCHNGNLSEWLFGKDKVLFWIQRLQIAIGSAKALWFLHTHPQGCIVHRDIKPTNVLIDHKFQAKLSDFGLSKVMNLDQSYVSSEVRGTFGYVDPDYRANRRVTPSGDVYSFGVVLLQLLSGKRVLDLNLNTSRLLTKIARSLEANGGGIDEFADPKLKREYSSEAFDIVFKLALNCTASKKQRPSMKQVVSSLEKALEISTHYSSVY